MSQISISASSYPNVALSIPQTRGHLKRNADLAPVTWFRVGGAADFLFVPADGDDLAAFFQELPQDIPVMMMGVGSNLLVRDGGVRGVVVRPGAGLGSVTVEPNHKIRVGVGALDSAVARAALEVEISGFEFLRGIPGSIGGALAMNAGCYGSEISERIVEVTALDRQGTYHNLNPANMGFSYRYTAAADKGLFFVEALLQGASGNRESITATMIKITESREVSQPMRTRTGGSTFKNPPKAVSGGRKAWQLIDAAGGRGLSYGNALVSTQHCNFLINQGEATATELETLGNMVRERVLENSGVNLQWEIRRIGEAVS
ncbi:MAG: UDP-N-acetylmuramate dehydrogenase [Parvularculales bacterium]